MSGPVNALDITGEPAPAEPQTFEILESRASTVGAFPVRRALPRRQRRTVSAWCFADHMGPASVGAELGLGVAPHPHIGLQTVTWLLEGEVLHRDSLGTEQLIRPGELNLMTAGAGVSHSEEGTGYAGRLHGVQLWVAQPDATRHGAPAFEHLDGLPRDELAPGVEATVIIGAFGSLVSPAKRDTDHFGVDLAFAAGGASLPMRPEHEHAVIVFDGVVRIEDVDVEPGRLVYLGAGRDELYVDSGRGTARALLIGGAPFDDELVMWWNYVARTRDEIIAAHDEWTRRDERFGVVASLLDPIDVAPPPWPRTDER
jgi:redox-sensitive bicupin YhaK (pirin superfamily)